MLIKPFTVTSLAALFLQQDCDFDCDQEEDCQDRSSHSQHQSSAASNKGQFINIFKTLLILKLVRSAITRVELDIVPVRNRKQKSKINPLILSSQHVFTSPEV